MLLSLSDFQDSLHKVVACPKSPWSSFWASQHTVEHLFQLLRSGLSELMHIIVKKTIVFINYIESILLLDLNCFNVPNYTCLITDSYSDSHYLTPIYPNLHVLSIPFLSLVQCRVTNSLQDWNDQWFCVYLSLGCLDVSACLGWVCLILELIFSISFIQLEIWSGASYSRMAWALLHLAFLQQTASVGLFLTTAGLLEKARLILQEQALIQKTSSCIRLLKVQSQNEMKPWVIDQRA